MEFDLRALTEAEEKYTYSQSMQISMQTGLLGYLRADMGRNGTDFFSDWFDFRKELKTEDFKKEFDTMIDSYRKDGKFLSNRSALAEFCQTLKCFKNDDRSFGVRVDSDNYAYLCRLNPNRSNTIYIVSPIKRIGLTDIYTKLKTAYGLYRLQTGNCFALRTATAFAYCIRTVNTVTAYAGILIRIILKRIIPSGIFFSSVSE